MKILITNDDGVHSPGLLALRRALSELGEVYVVAPDRPRSAAGHSITLHKPLRAVEVALADGSCAWASNGTPSDCVVLGTSDLLGCMPEMVVSGINYGANLGEDLTYSGTVSAAMEGTIMGLPSFAISAAGEAITNFDVPAAFAARLAKTLMKHRLPSHMLLNVNVPVVPETEIAGIAFTRQARRKYKGRLEKRIDPRGRAYYWLGGELIEKESPADTDVGAIERNKISITPIHLDLTEHDFIKEMQTWEI